MPGMTKKLEKLLHQTDQMISNSQTHPEVAAAMAKYGYDADRWAEGQALLDAVRDKVQANEAAFAAQLGATDTFNDAFEEVWDQTQSLAHLSATLFEGETETLRLLGLHKRRDESTGESELAWPQKSRSLSAFVPWANNLYLVAQGNSNIAEMLADFGYPAGRLSEESAEIQAMTQADNAQEIAKAEAQQSTVERDEAVATLQVWLRRTEKVAKLALKDKRQLLELMGLRAQRR